MRTRAEATKGKDTVASLSKDLDDALKGKPKDEEKKKGADDLPPLFENVNRKVQLSDDFERITERVFVKDPLKEYERLEKLLTIGEQRADYSTLLKHLDQAEDNARLAHRLWMTAKIERERYEMDAEVVQSAIRVQANKVLQKEKDDGLRTKQITDADTRAMASTLFPDQWREHELGLARVKRMEESVGDLSEKWASRCRTLQTMLSTLRK